jgi:hypothetical protein
VAAIRWWTKLTSPRGCPRKRNPQPRTQLWEGEEERHALFLMHSSCPFSCILTIPPGLQSCSCKGHLQAVPSGARSGTIISFTAVHQSWASSDKLNCTQQCQDRNRQRAGNKWHGQSPSSPPSSSSSSPSSPCASPRLRPGSGSKAP